MEIKRYKKNRIVCFLLDNGIIDLNKIWIMAESGMFNRQEMRQFYKLIGYSKGGYSEIDFKRLKR